MNADPIGMDGEVCVEDLASLLAFGMQAEFWMPLDRGMRRAGHEESMEVDVSGIVSLTGQEETAVTTMAGWGSMRFV
jgi:hypothetical protein